MFYIIIINFSLLPNPPRHLVQGRNKASKGAGAEAQRPLSYNAEKDQSNQIKQKAEIGVSLRHLTKVFPMSGNDIRIAVDDLNLDFNVGEVTALLGHNGAGKSTMM